MVVHAQSISLKYYEEVVDNDTVYISGDPDDDLMEWHLQVKNLTDKDIDVKVRKNEISLIENTVNTFCWGSCFMPSVYVSPSPITIRAGSTDYNSFAGDYEPSGMAGTSVITYTFFNMSDEKDSVMVTAFYQAGTSGKEDMLIDEPEVSVYPNPAGEYLNIEFHFIPERPVSIKLYDLKGGVLRDIQSFGLQKSNHRIDLKGISVSAALIEIISGTQVMARRKVLITR
jgi:hypothetical protein